MINVACTPATIVRASATPVSCTATASTGTLAVTGWTFTAADAATGPVTSTQTTSPWYGMAVATGIVTVQGTIDGIAAPSDTGRIAVTPRGWSWSADKSSGNATPGTFECNSNRHYATGNFGWMHADSTCANPGLMVWPDPTSSSRRGWTFLKVPSGPNAGLWYMTSDHTGMHIRAQVLKDIRPDDFTYSVSGKDTVATRCKAARVNGNQTVTVVNNTCMTDPSAFNFAALYAFAWRHEQCHLTQALAVFPTIPDPRTALEAIVRPDTVSLNFEAINGPNGYYSANAAITQANTIDTPNPNVYRLWSRNSSNSAWFLRSYQPNAILAPGC